MKPGCAFIIIRLGSFSMVSFYENKITFDSKNWNFFECIGLLAHSKHTLYNTKFHLVNAGTYF